MKQRIQHALDGDVDRFRLSATELDEVRHAESEIDAVLNAIPTRPLPDLAPAVLARIHRQAREANRSVAPTASRTRRARTSGLEWLWRPRQVSFGLRPAYALAATLLVGVLLTGQWLRSDRDTAPPAPQVFMRFVLRIPDANSVALAGDFTGWQPTFTLTRSGPDLWTVVVPLDPGVYTYSFVVDGERWISDPMAPAVDDGFGGANSRVAVLTPDARGL